MHTVTKKVIEWLILFECLEDIKNTLGRKWFKETIIAIEENNDEKLKKVLPIKNVINAFNGIGINNLSEIHGILDVINNYYSLVLLDKEILEKRDALEINEITFVLDECLTHVNTYFNANGFKKVIQCGEIINYQRINATSNELITVIFDDKPFLVLEVDFKSQKMKKTLWTKDFNLRTCLLPVIDDEYVDINLERDNYFKTLIDNFNKQELILDIKNPNGIYNTDNLKTDGLIVKENEWYIVREASFVIVWDNECQLFKVIVNSLYWNYLNNLGSEEEFLDLINAKNVNLKKCRNKTKTML